MKFYQIIAKNLSMMKCEKNTQNNSVITEEVVALKVIKNIPINMILRGKDMGRSRMRTFISPLVDIKNQVKKRNTKILMTKMPIKIQCMKNGKKLTKTMQKLNIKNAINLKIKGNTDHTMSITIAIKKRISIISLNKDSNSEINGIREIRNITV